MIGSDLRRKEIICTADGAKLGFADDLEFDTREFRVSALLCQKRVHGFWLFARREPIRIPVESIDIIGEDIILIKTYQTEIKLQNGIKNFWDRLFE